MTRVTSQPIKASPIVKARQRRKSGQDLHLQNFSRLIGVILIVFSCILIPLAGGIVYYFSIQSSDVILDNLETAGLKVGGKTIPQAAVLLHQVWNIDNKITVTDGISTVTVSPQALGIKLDPLKTATRAYQFGRKGTIFQRISDMIETTQGMIYIDPVISVDIDEAKKGLELLATMMDKPAIEAQFSLENGSPQVIPGETGHAIHQLHALSILSSEPSAVLFGGKLTLLSQPVQPNFLDLSFLVDQANQILTQKPEVKFYDPLRDETTVIPLARELIASWITVTQTSLTPELTFDNEKVSHFLAEYNAGLAPERFIDYIPELPEFIQAIKEGRSFTITIHYNPTTYTIQPGDTLLSIGWRVGFPYWMIAKANPGLNPDKLTAGETIVIPSKEDLLPLPIIPGKRIVINISKQRLWAYENGEVVSKQVISTGIDKSPTQPGIFQVRSHVPNAYASVWDLHMPNFLGVYEAWPGFMNGIHGLPTLSNGKRLWANVLGKPASFGCIILDLEPAEWLYNWAEDGVIVEIQP